MNYYLDTEFHEYFRKPLFGKSRHVIDLISIGIVSADGREYYAICKDFDLKAAWNSWQPRTGQGDRNNHQRREYWLRENVLRPIYDDLFSRVVSDDNMMTGDEYVYFNVHNIQRLINRYGKTGTQIAQEIFEFCNPYPEQARLHTPEWHAHLNKFRVMAGANTPPVFYGYYADYDWVVFCSLFGKMMNLPQGFPMYCRDLKQTRDEIFDQQRKGRDISDEHIKGEFRLNPYKKNYPEQANEHNALADARWNQKLHAFLKER